MRSGYIYRQTSNISRALISNKIVEHLDVVGAWGVGAARLNTWLNGLRQLQDEVKYI